MTRVNWGYFTAGLLDALNGAVILALPYVALSLNAGRLGTAANIIMAAGYTVICFIVSRVRIFSERRHTMVLGLLIYTAGCALIYAKKSVFVLLFAPAVLSVANALFYTAVQPWFTEGMDRPQLMKTMGGYSIAWVLGFLAGPSIGGLVISSGGNGAAGLAGRLDALFLFSGAASLAMCVLFIPDIWKQKIVPLSESAMPAIFRKAIPQEKCRMFLHLTWIANFCTMFPVCLVRFLFTEMGKEERLSSFVIGNVNSAMYLSLIILVLFLMRRTFWLFSFRYLVFFQLAAAPAVLFFVLSKNVGFYFSGAVIFGLLLGFTYFSSSFYSLIFEGKKDRYVSINESLIGLGQVLAGGLGYLIAESAPLKYSFLPALAVIVLAIVAESAIYLLFLKRNSSVSAS
jgi:MFS family permease